LVQSHDLHTAWLNAAALRLIGTGSHSPGLLREAECFAAVSRFCADPLLSGDEEVVGAMHRAASRGVVGILDFEMADNVADWRRRAQAADLPVRVECSVPRTRIDATVAAGLRTGDAVAPQVTVGPVKLFLDGSLTSGTASTAAGAEPLIPEEELRSILGRLADHGLEVALHAIGDGATALALDAFEATGARGRIEHAQLLRPADLGRFRDLGVIASVQPTHLCMDRDLPVWSRFDSSAAYRYASLLRSGATVQFGSDAPVVPMDPWASMAAAITRTADERDAWHAAECLTLDEALGASTRGRLVPRPGDAADLMILGHRTLERDTLTRTVVQGTLVAGRWSHRDALAS
ncbi:MAG: amidohydrolase family protein, partial [Microbacterium sp.]